MPKITTVKDLRDFLKDLPDDMPVLIETSFGTRVSLHRYGCGWVIPHDTGRLVDGAEFIVPKPNDEQHKKAKRIRAFLL